MRFEALLRAIAACAAVAFVSAGALAGDLKSGLQPGDDVGAFQVEKVAGAVNDFIEPGRTLCYRCLLGSRPVVMVFARKVDPGLVALVKRLDRAVVDEADHRLAAVVNLIGRNPEELKKAGAELAKKHELENVAFVVPQDNENGPSEFNISPDAETTLMLYRRGKVAANFAVPPGKLDEATIRAIVDAVEKMLK